MFLPLKNSLLERSKLKNSYIDVSLRKHCANMYLELLNKCIIGKISQVDHSRPKVNITSHCTNPYLEISCQSGILLSEAEYLLRT